MDSYRLQETFRRWRLLRLCPEVPCTLAELTTTTHPKPLPGGEGGSLSLPKAHPHAMGISGLGASFILASLPFRVAILTPANTSLAPPLLNI